MARFASAKWALGISDRSGRAYRLKNMILEWNGSLVGRDEYGPKQPQLYPKRVKSDPQALRISRTDRTEPPVSVLLGYDSFKSGTAGSTTITVHQPGHQRTTGDTVRFRDVLPFDGFTESMLETAAGFTITVIAASGSEIQSNYYTFTATGGETATTGDVEGGGGEASAGPVTVEA